MFTRHLYSLLQRGTTASPTLQVRKLRFRGIKWLAKVSELLAGGVRAETGRLGRFSSRASVFITSCMD